MSYLIANQTGDFGTAATWDTGTNTPTLHASTNITLSSTPQATAAFTAPSLTDDSTGVLLYLVSKDTATTITATLQESLAGTFADTAHTVTIDLDDVNEASWINLRPASPYTFATTTASRYRWMLSCDTGSPTVARASTANPAFISTDDRHAVPVDGDYVVIVPAAGTSQVVTLDGTRACGNGGSIASSRSITNAVYITAGGRLEADTASTCQLTIRGSVEVDVDGEIRAGTVASPYPAAQTATFIIDGATNGGYNVVVEDGGKATLQGSPKSSTTLWKAKYVSGSGTAASPLVVSASVDWSVGDEILVTPTSDGTSNFDETESRFIITKNSATSYVVSDTQGGSEAALTHTHTTDADVVNVERNVVIRGDSSATGTFFNFKSQTNTGNVDIDWVRLENIASNTFFGVAINYIDIHDNCACDYSVAYQSDRGLWRFENRTDGATHTGLIAYTTTGSSVGENDSASFVTTASTGLNLVDCFSLGNNANGWAMGSTYSSTLTRCKAVGSARSEVAGSAGLLVLSSGQNVFTDCEFHANGVAGIRLAGGSGNVFNDCLLGTKGENQTIDIQTASGTFNATLFASCTFGSDTQIDGYKDQTTGSEIRFNRLNDTENVHEWYDTFGSGVSEDTVIRSPGLSVKLRPENLETGFTWQFQIPVSANSIARFPGFFLKNSDLGTGVVTVSMYLPGNPVGNANPDATATLDNTTGSAFTDDDEQSVDISANYTADIPGAAEIVVNVKSETAGAALYCDDFFNAGDRSTTFDEITGLNLWVDGKPLSVISPSVPSAADTAAAVWAYAQANANIVGSMGEKANDDLTTDQYRLMRG